MMIHSYKFRNFFSFAEWAEVSFVVNKKVPETELIFTSPAGLRLSKLMTIIGANGSGKTNALKTLPFISWFICRSFSALKPDDDIPVETHFFSESEKCEFELEFEVLSEIYRYTLVISKERVFEESLYIKSKKFFSYLFKREWNKTESRYDIAQQKFGFIKSEAEKVRSNASLISTAAQYEVACAKELVSYFQTCEYTVNYGGRTLFIPNNVFDASENFYSNPKLQKHMVKLLCGLDLGISDLVIEKRKVTDESGKEFEMYIPFGIHKSGSKTHKLHLIYESSGTQRAFVLLDKFLPLFDPKFKSGGLAVIDEMESDLHPDMLRPLLDLFIDTASNPNNSQIIFTCHAHEVLDIVDKSQVQIVEKNEAGESEVWRLDDIKGVRRDENIYAKYRAGTYGGVPDI